MSIAGVSCILGEVSMPDHLKCMLAEAPCGISPSVLEVITRPNLEREGVVFSPSSIQGCHRQFVLKGRHEWYIPVDKAWPSARGTIFHHGMGKLPAPEGTIGVIRELRMFAAIDTEFGEQQFSGQIDEILLMRVEDDVLHVRITDWKTKSDIPHSMIEPERRHLYQINYYAWLVTEALRHYLDNWDTIERNPSSLLSLRQAIPEFKSVRVEEISVSYLAGNKIRTFVSSRLLSVRGKMKGESSLGRDGQMHWHKYVPEEYEALELMPIHMFQLSYIEGLLRSGIEAQIKAQTEIAAPLVGDDAQLMCGGCPVRMRCIELGCNQGYDMSAQRGAC